MFFSFDLNWIHSFTQHKRRRRSERDATVTFDELEDNIFSSLLFFCFNMFMLNNKNTWTSHWILCCLSEEIMPSYVCLSIDYWLNYNKKNFILFSSIQHLINNNRDRRLFVFKLLVCLLYSIIAQKMFLFIYCWWRKSFCFVLLDKWDNR